MTSPAPETILHDEIALSVLKRPQLVQLCKEFGCKANGKNVELVAKLLAHGKALLEHSEQGEAETSWAMVSEPDEQAVAMQEGDRMTEFGIQTGGVSSLTGTAVSSSSSSNSLASTIRSATGTLLRRLHSPSKSSASLASLAPTIIAEPEPPSLVSTFTESPRPPTPKIYPSLSPTSIASYSASPRPTVGSMIDSPRSYISGGIRVVNLQAEESESDMSKGDMSLDDVSFDAVPKGTTHLGRLKSGDTPPPAPSPAFTFGSPSNATEAASSSFTFSTFPSAPTSSTEPASGNSKTAAELVMEEMNRRALESRAAGPPKFSFGGGSGTGSGMAPSTAEKGKRKFEESHSRAFDRMDSITNHYAAKRTLPTSTSSGNLARSVSARSLHHSTSTAPQPAAKRMKLPSSTSTPFGLSTNAPSIKPKVEPTPRTKSADKRIVSGLLGEGWASAAPAQSVSLAASIRSTAGASSSASTSRVPTSASTLGMSTTTKAEKGKMREGLYPNDGKDAEREMEREERKRKLELAKARRKSQVGGAVGGRRRSMTVGPKPREGNAASRWMKSTYKKLTTNAAPAPPPVPSLPRSFSTATNLSTSTSSRFAPASSTSSAAPKHAFGAGPSRAPFSSNTASPSTAKKEPGWKKFDLQASLAKPLSYTPKLGPLHREPTSSASRPRPVSSISSLASTSSAFGAGPSSSSHKRTSSLSSRPTPARGLSLSQRVANPVMLGAVKPSAIAEEAPRMEIDDPSPTDSLPGAFSFDFPAVPTTTFPSTPNATSTSAMFPSLPSTHTPLPFQPLTNAPSPRPSAAPTRKFGAAPASARKTRTVARAVGGVKGTKSEKAALESRARKVVAKRTAGGGASGSGRVG